MTEFRGANLCKEDKSIHSSATVFSSQFPSKRPYFMSSFFFPTENHDVTYYELPSIYGHDTFLLDVVAVGAAVKVGYVVFRSAYDSSLKHGVVGERCPLKTKCVIFC